MAAFFAAPGHYRPPSGPYDPHPEPDLLCKTCNKLSFLPKSRPSLSTTARWRHENLRPTVGSAPVADTLIDWPGICIFNNGVTPFLSNQQKEYIHVRY
jgi:hypothetical protein